MKNHRLSADPAPTRTPVPADKPKAIAAICRALELPPDASAATARAAFDALFGTDDAQAQANQVAASKLMSASERKAAADAGCDALTFVQMRAFARGGRK